MEILPATLPPDKGLWLTSTEIEALGAAKAAARDAREATPDGESAAWAAVAQADVLRYTSWRARFMALAEAVQYPGTADPRALAMAILDAAPASRGAVQIPCPDELEFYEGAAIGLLGRASGSQLRIGLSADEARAHADCIWDLVYALRELA
jgi:hypothetical protein